MIALMGSHCVDARSRVPRHRAPYHDDHYVAAFARHRHLQSSLRGWYVADLVDSLLIDTRSRTLRFLDIGAGTGQFAAEVARIADERALSVEITVLEPSGAFRRYLHNSQCAGRYRLVSDRIETYAPDVQFDLILASEVAHVLESHPDTFRRLHDMTSVGGVIALRYGTRPQVQRRNWYRCFPHAGAIDFARAPNVGTYEAILGDCGFRCDTAEIDESVVISDEQWLRLVSDRAYSSFRLVDDSAFKHGVKRLQDLFLRGVGYHQWRSWMSWTKAWRTDG